MTQIVFLLYEDVSKPEGSESRYHVDIHFSPGVRCGGSASSTKEKQNQEINGQLPFVKRLPAVISSSPETFNGNGRRFSEQVIIKTTDDQSRTNKEAVARRFSEQQPRSSCASDFGRMKSLSETEVAVPINNNKKSQEDVSRSMDSLDQPFTHPLPQRKVSGKQHTRKKSAPALKIREENSGLDDKKADSAVCSEHVSVEKQSETTDDKQLKSSSLGERGQYNYFFFTVNFSSLLCPKFI